MQAAAVDERIATDAWVKAMEARLPWLVGQIGRPPTRSERRHWDRESEKRKMDLIVLKLRYLRSGFKEHLIKYLQLRVDCGYIEGVKVPDWLWKAGKT